MRNLHGTFLKHLLSEENIGEAWWHTRTHCSAVWLLVALIVKFEHILKVAQFQKTKRAGGICQVLFYLFGYPLVLHVSTTS